LNILAGAIDNQESDWKNRVVHDFRKKIIVDHQLQVLSEGVSLDGSGGTPINFLGSQRQVQNQMKPIRYEEANFA
jgi:hypothetical protein